MDRIPAMVDMARSKAEKVEKAAEMMPGPVSAPDYPYGLCICLGEDELQKLGLDENPEIGDMLHLHAMAKVTSVSQSESEGVGKNRRVELQITHMVGENEDEENEEADKATPAAERRSKLYTK